MILFFEYGRLGNQLFQYMGLKQFFPGQRLIFIGCDDLHAVIEIEDVTFIQKKNQKRWLIIRLFVRVMSILIRLRSVGLISEVCKESSYAVNARRGLLWGIYLLQHSYFQHNSVTNRFEDTITIRQQYIQLAKSWLNANSVQADRNNLVFLHIRRGDYLSWPNRTSPAVLSLSWYQRAMASIKASVSNPLFIVLTDDLYYAKDVFCGQSDVLISENNHLVDFALMSLCHHGILSASSFAWWGAWFSRQSNAENDLGIYLAPNYWTGHRLKQWSPEGFVTDWITYIE
jgi:hypothetical protein